MTLSSTEGAERQSKATIQEELTMDTQRLGTSHSQRAFIPMHELEHSAPEVVQHPIPAPPQAFPVEKAGYPPTPSYSPAIYDQHRQSCWAPSEFEAVPPQYSPHYPGAPASQPAALVVPPIDAHPNNEETICGIRRGLFIIILAFGGLVLLGIAVGVGVGVGIGGSHNGNSGGAAARDGSTTISPMATQTNSAPGSTATEDGDSCPGISSTQYSASNGKKFLHLCGLDYSGPGQATDIGSVKTSNFADCMEACAKRDDCEGAGWGPPSGSNKSRQTCYMKKDLQTSHDATGEWNFAVLLDVSGKARYR